MQKALISAASTDNDDRHEILSELIAQRLTAEADDLEALSGAAACDVVLALSSMHIRLLGVAVAALHLLPLTTPEGGSALESPESPDAWWDQNLGPLCTPDLRRVSPMDFRHLAGLACVSVNVIRNDLLKVFHRPTFWAIANPVLPQMEKYAWWEVFMHVWVAGLQNVTLTSVGTLIGIMYRDRTLNKRTDIRWEAKRPDGGT